MSFEEVLDQAIALLQRRGRVTCRMLKRHFHLDAEELEDLTFELIKGQRLAVAEDGEVLVWTGEPLAAKPGAQRRAQAESWFYALIRAVMWMLQRERRLPYRELKHIFGLDDALLEEIREDLTFRRLALDQDGKGLVWIGEAQPAVQTVVAPSRPPAFPDTAALTSPASSGLSLPPTRSASLQDEPAVPPEPTRSAREAERRQLTVMFCDVADSTKLSQQLDPEDLREVIRAYQATAVEVIHHYAGYVAQYLGDGLLVYFGWPVAHEDDAQRALHAGLGIIEAITISLNPRLEREKGVQVAVRVGIHTGPVVVGEMGGGARHEHLATGETVNIASRLEGLAASNTVVISHVTARLVQGVFALENLGRHALKGVAEPMQVFRVLGPMERHEDETVAAGVPLLVGRDEEMGLLVRRWEQSKEGLGQVVLVSGTAGIGKSSLVETLRAQVRQEGMPRIAFRCSSYHQNSALYPVITHVERRLDLQREDTPATKLDKLEQGLRPSRLPLDEVVPLFASLLSVPMDDRYPALTLTPQQQKQQTLDALVAWILEDAEQQPVLVAWEDLHWADPSTLEMLGLVLEQTPTVPMLHVLTFRSEFEPSWPTRSHMTPITLNRLERPQVEALLGHLAGGKPLPAEVVEHIVGKTDGVPLYVEELTKMLLESDLLREEADRYELTGPLRTVAIPDTLQDSLMARLDQLNAAKEVAQLGSVLGREFPFALLRAVWSQDEETLQTSLAQLVEAELLYQRGRPPRATYVFKHALIQDAAYQSLLRSARQQLHQQIAQLMESQFPETIDTQPELLAHHYTEAGRPHQAVPYWQRAGERAIQRSANAEAIRHLSQAIALLGQQAESVERHQQELDLQIAISAPLLASKGFASLELEAANTRARALCEMIGRTPQIIPALSNLQRYYNIIGQRRRAFDVSQESYRILQQSANIDPAWIAIVDNNVGATAMMDGDFASALRYEQHGVAHCDVRYRETQILVYGEDMGITCRGFLATVQWCLGYPEQARKTLRQAHERAEQFSHPFSVSWTNTFALYVSKFLDDVGAIRDQAAATHAFSVEHGLPSFEALNLLFQAWAEAAQEQSVGAVAQIEEVIAAFDTIGFKFWGGYFRSILAEAYQAVGQTAEALRVIDEAIAYAERFDERLTLAEIHRLKGALLVQQATPEVSTEAESCLQHALSIARHQHAKSWELRTATSLARLWQSQGKRQEAYDLLAPVYHWFTEGFDTADLQEAKALLEALSS